MSRERFLSATAAPPRPRSPASSRAMARAKSKPLSATRIIRSQSHSLRTAGAAPRRSQPTHSIFLNTRPGAAERATSLRHLLKSKDRFPTGLLPLRAPPHSALSAHRPLRALVGGVAGTLTNTGVISLTNGTGVTCSGTNPGSCSLAAINANSVLANNTGASAIPTAIATSTGLGILHSVLGNLAWTSSGHTGTANRIPYFNSAGAAAEVASSSLNLGVSGGGTGLTSVTQGDLLYASAANTLTTLAKDTNSTRYLSNQGASN